MISPSEAGVLPETGFKQETGPAAKPLNEGWSSPGPVHPLQFKAIDHPLRRRTDWLATQDDDQDAVAMRLREEMATLDGRFRAQTVRTEQQVVEAREAARLEARQEWKAELELEIARERGQLVEACAAFRRERAAYFAGVEGEVVRLALAIAARVLHREARLDPMLLTAVVRMALEKVADESGTTLHVPLGQVEAWRAVLGAGEHTGVVVVGEERMQAAECVLETSVGRVELGVAEQLEEIERGFFDLLQQRPV